MYKQNVCASLFVIYLTFFVNDDIMTVDIRYFKCKVYEYNLKENAMIERATMVKIFNFNRKTGEIIFYVPKKMYWILVTEFKEGIVTVEPYAGETSFISFYEILVGCLNEESNFGHEVIKTYGDEERQVFYGVKYYDGERGIILRAEDTAGC